jgi:hypothetical protein
LGTIAGKPVDRIPIWPPIPWQPLTPEPEPGDWKCEPNYRQLVAVAEEKCDFLVPLKIPERASDEDNLEEAARRAPYGGIFDRRFFLSPPDRVDIVEEPTANGGQRLCYKVHTPKGVLTGTDEIRPATDTTWLVEPLVKDVDDAEKLLSVPYRFDTPDLASYFAHTEKLGDRGVPVCFVTSPMVMVSHMMDLEKFLEWSILERPLIERMIRTIHERVAERLQFALSHGVGPLYRFGGSEQATPPLMSKRDFDDFILGYEAPLWKMTREAGQIAWVHCHGKVGTILDDYIAGGAQMLDPVEPPPQGDIEIGDAKRRAAAGPMTMVGNIEISDLYQATPSRIGALVQHAVCEGGRRYFILGPSDVVISKVDDQTRDNILGMIESGIKYGTFDNGSNPCD